MGRQCVVRRSAAVVLSVAMSLPVLGQPSGQGASEGNRSVGSSVRRRSPDPIAAPGMLRPTGSVRPTGGNIRPVGGDLRPSGGGVRPTAGDIRPIGIGSPLSGSGFEARLRPRTPAFGVTGTVIEPGWDAPPWERSSNAGRGGGGLIDVGSAGVVGGYDGGEPPVTDPTRAVPPRLPVFPMAPVPPSTAAPASPTVVQAPQAAREARSAQGWSAPLSATVIASRRGDARPDLRLAARLTREGRLSEAVAAVRQSVYQSPGAYLGHASVFAGDPALEAQVREALAAYTVGSEGGRGAVSADRAFMSAALSAALGERAAAASAIEAAREAGEHRPSGQMLYRVLTQSSAPSVEVPAAGAQP